MRVEDRSSETGGPQARAITPGTMVMFMFLLGVSLSGGVFSRGSALAQWSRPESPPVQTLDEQNQALEQVAQSVTPAIVNVQTTHVVRVQDSPLMNDPELKQFFGEMFGQEGTPKEQRERALGSGVIISPEGYIVTNSHLLNRATQIQVQLSDGRVFKGRLVGADPQTDVAVLQIDGRNLPCITWGQSSNVRVGDTVLAFGNPFGLNFTVTRGIVSAVGRSGLGLENLEDFIQTDAAINPGNSGGALVDVHGAVVGINTAIVSPGASLDGGSFNGVGLAIPSDIVRHSAESLISTGKVERGYLGVSLSNLTPRLARQFKVPDVSGALVQDLDAGSPAEKAGVKVGDVIRAVNGRTIGSQGQAISTITQLNPGDRVTLSLLRDGRPIDLAVSLANAPENVSAVESDEDPPPAPGCEEALDGLTVQDLTRDARSQLGLAQGARGVVITGIDPSSPAAVAGLRAGDVIQEINRQPVKNVKDFARLGTDAKDDVLLRIERQGNGAFVVVSPEDGAEGE